MTRSASDWAGNILAFSVTIAVNAMATGIPLGGRTPREISDAYPSLFTPSGLTFSIWALIYLGLTLFVVYQALPPQRDNTLLARIGPLFKANCLANAAWILAWHYGFLALSVLIMVFILTTLVLIYRLLQDHRSTATGVERLAMHWPFRLYTGWICVALIANISTVQNAMGWDDVAMGAITWTLLKLALAGTIAAAVLARKGDVIVAGVVAWAAYGIYLKQTATPAVSGAALSLCLLLVMISTLELIRQLRAGRS
jgi:hypothetical protein